MPTNKEEERLVNQLRAAAGMKPVHRVNRKKVRSVTLSDDALAGLQTLAAVHEYYTNGRGANVSGFLEALGMGLYLVTPREEADA